MISPHVKREVVDEGKRKGVPDALILEKLFKGKVFKVMILCGFTVHLDEGCCARADYKGKS